MFFSDNITKLQFFSSNIHLQGYASEKTLAEYNGTITAPLASFTVCMRVQVQSRIEMTVFGVHTFVNISDLLHQAKNVFVYLCSG